MSSLQQSSPPRSALNSKLPRSLLAATCLAALALTLPVAGQTTAAARAEVTAEEKALGYSSRFLLAKPRAGGDLEELAASEAREGLATRKTFPRLGNLHSLEISDRETVDQAITRLQATGRYEYVERDYVMTATAIPNDPRYLATDQWALRNIGQSNGRAGADIKAEEGWDIQNSAAGVVVAVIDSGIRHTHQDLSDNLWINTPESGTNGNDLNDNDNNGYIDDIFGINSTVPLRTVGSGAPVDVEGHGTAVASVIGARGDNRVGMTGVAWNVRLMSLRFIGASGGGFVSDEIECIDYAIAKRANLINASFGGSSFSQSLFDTLKRARDAGIIVVCSAGNDAENSDLSPHYPAGYLLDNIVAVANTTRTDTLATSSTYGSGIVELGAPGTSILAADFTGDANYQFISGTSFSAPMVTGALALLKAKFPDDNYRQLINRLLSSVDPLPALAGKTATGGRLNLAAALRSTHGRPFNDDFARRATFDGESGRIRGAAQFSTRETGEPVHAGSAGNGSLWWTWTAPRSGPVTLETTGSDFDTLLAVYTGSTLASLTSVVSNDDQSGSLPTSKVTFTATAGTAYQIAVDRKTAGSGLVVLRLELQAANDAFASAQPVTGRSWTVTADNRNATRETDEPRIRSNAGGRSMWFRWVAPATRRYHLATFSDALNTMIGVYTGSAIGSLTEVASSLTGGDSNVTIVDASVSINATAGTTYYIAVDSEVSATGASNSGSFRLACVDSDWEFFGFGDIGTPALAADGTMHFVDDFGILYGLNPDGTRKWRYTMTGFATFSAPAVAADGTVYIGDDFFYVHAVNPDGTRKWRIQTGGMVEASPAIASDGTIYIRSDDRRLYALNPADGSTKWSYQFSSAVATTYTSPVVAPDGTIYCAGPDSKLYAFTPQGAVRWSYATDFIFASPAIARDGTIYLGVSSPTSKLIALRSDGTLKWEFTAGDTVSSSAAIGADGTVYFGCADSKIYALASTGELKWTFQAGGAIRNSSPIIANDGSIYVGCLDGKVYGLEPDGTLRRTFCTAGEVRASPLLINGKLLLSSYDFRIYAVDVALMPASTEWPMHRQNLRRNARPQYSPLGIGVQPRSYTAEVGETITLSVAAVGTGPLTYQWLFNGQAITGATGTSFRIDPVTHAQGGQYSVRVTDSTGTVTSNTVTLTISTPLVAPTIFRAPVSQSVLAGQSVSLSVTPAGTVPFTYQWLRNGEPISGATSNTLVIDPVRLSDAANYSVVVTNFGGRITSSAATVSVGTISRLSNLSIRCQVGGGAGTLTVGLTVGGANTTGNKSLLLRAVGPTLAAFGVPGTLADPKLELLSGSTVIAQNDDWAGSAQVSATSVAVGAFAFADPTSKDAALPYSTAAAGYTVRITGAPGGSGVALAEIYDATPNDSFLVASPRLINVSALTQAGTGGDVLIAGFTISGTGSKTVLVRGVGPTLGAFGVPGVLADPKLELYPTGASAPLATNDNWGAASNATQIASAATSVGAFALPSDSRDAVLLLTLPAGSYTAQVSGVNNGTGLALIEVYEVP